MSLKRDTRMNKESRKDIIVAVRMPKGLVEELRDLQQINHFMDISDEIRYIIRKYCLNIMGQSKQTLDDKRKEKLIDDLNTILTGLKEGTDEKQ